MKKTRSLVCVLFVLVLSILAMAVPAAAAEPNEPVVYDFTTFEEVDPTPDDAVMKLETEDYDNMIIRTFGDDNTKYLQISNKNFGDLDSGYVAYTVNAPEGEKFTAMDLSVDFNRLCNYQSGSATDFSIYIKVDDGEYQQVYTKHVEGDSGIKNVPVDVTEKVAGASKVTVKLELKVTNPVNYGHDWAQIKKLTINNSSVASAVNPGPGTGENPNPGTGTNPDTGDVLTPICAVLAAAATGLVVLTFSRKKISD